MRYLWLHLLVWELRLWLYFLAWAWFVILWIVGDISFSGGARDWTLPRDSRGSRAKKIGSTQQLSEPSYAQTQNQAESSPRTWYASQAWLDLVESSSLNSNSPWKSRWALNCWEHKDSQEFPLGSLKTQAGSLESPMALKKHNDAISSFVNILINKYMIFY